MTALAPAPRDFSDAIAVGRGDPLFTSTGCSETASSTTVAVETLRAQFVRTTVRVRVARNALNALSGTNQHNLLQFVRSLERPYALRDSPPAPLVVCQCFAWCFEPEHECAFLCVRERARDR
jgi:hypothetical protein